MTTNNYQNMINMLVETGTVDNNIGSFINKSTMEVLNKPVWDNDDMELVYFILQYSNIIWENLDINMLPLDDGVYDILRESYKNHGGTPPVGGISVNKDVISSQIIDNTTDNMIIPARCLSDIVNNEDLLYTDVILHHAELNKDDILVTPALIAEDISKRKRDTSHQYPNLVGTLEKCKFVMKYQAEEKGVLDNPSVRVLERDFFGDHIKRGIITPERVFSVILMLKFDGVSVEGDVIQKIYTSRGDAIGGVAADLTPIMRNYRFPHQPYITDTNSLGVQFEAIMTYANLARFNAVKGYNYKNCRTAISGLFSSSDAWKYMDYVTLVPLASSLGVRKDIELEFLNRYYSNGIHNAYEVITGNVTSILYQIKKFTEEAEMMRDYVPFQYDGIVLQYLDEDIINALGRSNAINNYAQAVKFNPLKKQTIFTGYTYTVGQDGYITPMINYKPVEFMGTIHPNSSGHSYERFKQLNLHIGDIIDVEYVNDVMPYVTKPDNSFNDENAKLFPLEEFPTVCPACGNPISISKSGKSAYCTNIYCNGRKIARMVNMLDKLGFQQFADANLEKIGLYSFKELMTVSVEHVEAALNSDVMAKKFDIQRKELLNSDKWDYEILGSIGFDAIAKQTWKLILNKISLDDICNLDDETLYTRLINIKGIGKSKAQVILDRKPYFIDDINFIINQMPNLRRSFGYTNTGKKIRFSGFRDKDLVEMVTELGHDISDGSVTRDTSFLIVPNESYTSSKVDNAIKYGIPIILLSDFISNMNVYLE